MRQFVSGKKITQLKASGFVGIRAMDGIVFNVAGPLLADRTFLGVGRVGGAHKFAQIGDGILFLQRQYYDWAAGHEIGQRTEKRPRGMDGVKLLRLMFRNFEHLHGQYPETVFLELHDDVAYSVLAYGIRFDDGKSALQSLHSSVVCPWSLVAGPYFVFTLSLRRPLPPPLSHQYRPGIWLRECLLLPLL